MTGEIKKSYNPFKMWGSYVGSILYLGLVLILDNFRIRINEDFLLAPIYPFLRLVSYVTKNFVDCSNDACWGIGIITVFISIIISGFLIGWGVHSLIRRTRN